MKILFLTRSPGRTGGTIVYTTLIRELTKRGFDIELACLRPQGQPDIPDDSLDLYGDLNLKLIDIPAHANPQAQYRAYIDGGAEFLRQHVHGYDVVILDSWYVMMSGALAGVTGLPHVYQLAQRDPVFEPETDAKIWTAIAFGLAGAFPMKRIVVGRSLTTTLRERYGVECPTLDVYVDDVFRQGEFEVRDRTPLKFLASAADFNLPWKGLGFLLDSLSLFSASPFTLTLVTTKPIERDLSSLPFQVDVARARNPTEMRQQLLDHDVYLCGATSESFCLALAEAVTLGMPAIALDSVGNRDYAHGDNFYFVEHKQDFLPRLADICQLENRRQLHHVARESMGSYTVDAMVEQFIQALGLKQPPAS